MNPEYPVYIISKSRWEKPLTARQLEQRGIPYHIVIEPHEYDHYAAVINPERILTLPFRDVGCSIPARNWVWEHSIARGFARHWILDDNIRSFYRLHQNRKWETTDGTGFRVIEAWADRFENVALAGMQYEKFAPHRQAHPPVVLNTRVYSCILVNNALPFRWRGKYNEDTDLSLRALKSGWCTALFYAFLAEKVTTGRIAGGNTQELYADWQTGRLKMALALQAAHPDVVKVVRKWNRWQHQVDYTPFASNRLYLKPGVVLPTGRDNFGLDLMVEE